MYTEITSFLFSSSMMFAVGFAGYFGFKSRKKEQADSYKETKSLKLSESDRLYQNLIENSLDGFFRTSVDGKFIFANSAMAKILGYSALDDIKKIDIVNDIYKCKEDREKLLKLLDKSEIIKNYRITLKRKDGSELIARINERVYKDDDDNPIYYEGSLQDISQQVKVEIIRKKELDKLKEEKRAANYEASNAVYTSNVKSQFLAKMSHEIRTPMNSVLGFLTLIENGLFDSEEELKDFSANARISADSLLDVINNLLDISKIEAGKMELNEDEFSIDSEIGKAISITSSGAKEKEITVTKSVAENIPDTLIGDSIRYRQVIVNLLGNSIKYSKMGKINIDAKILKTTEATIKIETSVTDTGKGIPQEKLSEIFKPYTQLKDDKWAQTEGAGLGLMICKEFVTLMGGDINIESEVGKGTKVTFTVLLTLGKDFLDKLKIEREPEVPVATAEVDKIDESNFLERKAEAEELKRIPELEKPIQNRKSEEEIKRSEQIDEMLDNIVMTDLIEDPDAEKEDIAMMNNEVGVTDVGDKKRLLLVEDNPISQKVELKLLREAGYAADPVSNGFDAIEAAKTNSFDLILMDVEMDDLSGLEATRKIRELAPPVCSVPIIAVTAHSSMKDREKCLASGMDDYIAKPINVQFLKMTIDQWLKKER